MQGSWPGSVPRARLAAPGEATGTARSGSAAQTQEDIE
jgi:hypothetical protein